MLNEPEDQHFEDDSFGGNRHSIAAAGGRETTPSGKRQEKPEQNGSLLTAFQEIRRLIVHGRMSPGTWIVEADLAERLNMSRGGRFVHGCFAGQVCHNRLKKRAFLFAKLFQSVRNE